MIEGFTNRARVQYAGKIRGGFKKDESSFPVNTPHFLLHDAPGLENVLGKEPKEIFTTLLYDDPEAVARIQLLWYKKNDKVCQGNGKVAAYYENGEKAGVKQSQAVFIEKNFLGETISRAVPRSRERVCQFTNCPDFINRLCKKHLDFVFAVPQFSMASLFALDSVSDYTMNSVLDAIHTAQRHTALRRRPRKISGEIFRIYKQKEPVKFTDKNGKRLDSEKDVTFIDWVPFELFEKSFKDKVPALDWTYLLDLRESGIMVPGMEFASPEQLQVTGPAAQAQLAAPSGSLDALAAPDPVKDLEVLKARANHDVAAPHFEELAKLAGKENTEAMRIATAKMFPEISGLVDALKKKIAKYKQEAKAKEAASAPLAPPTKPAATPEVLPPETGARPPVQSQAAAQAAQGGLF